MRRDGPMATLTKMLRLIMPMLGQRADVDRWRSAINHLNPDASARNQMEELKIRAETENRETNFEYQ